jgi:proton-translocating NADH-quinone oxidoreductase chain L
MYTDPFLIKFISYLSLFTSFMLLLVSANNFLGLFVGWEGVGLCSYLLIGFWHTRTQAGKAATKAFLINKIGDLFLLIGIGFLCISYSEVGGLNINLLSYYSFENILELISLFFFIGAVGKSAQVGLHTWLPDAMEGPTPVSALIHAATMVTAGVFLLIKIATTVELAPSVLVIIVIWGGLTALISGLIGSTQNDIKKIIAYSTCSQLGYMILACGMSNYITSFFHLFNHAFFKALLFLAAGSIIHFIGNEQDIRKMGGLSKISPFSYLSFIIASLALAGFPFSAGFYSKDLIIETAETKLWVGSSIIYWIVVSSAGLTSIYSLHLFEYVFWSFYGGSKVSLFKVNSVTFVEICILSFLAVVSIVVGFIAKDIFINIGSAYYSSATQSLINSWNIIEAEFLSSKSKLLPLSLAVFSVDLELRKFEYKFFFNEMINSYLSFSVLFLSRHVYEQTEKRLLELGPVVLARHIIAFKNRNKQFITIFMFLLLWISRFYYEGVDLDRDDSILAQLDFLFFNNAEPVVAAAPEPVVAAAPEPVVAAAPEPVVAAAPEPVVAAAPEDMPIVQNPTNMPIQGPRLPKQGPSWWDWVLWKAFGDITAGAAAVGKANASAKAVAAIKASPIAAKSAAAKAANIAAVKATKAAEIAAASQAAATPTAAKVAATKAAAAKVAATKAAAAKITAVETANVADNVIRAQEAQQAVSASTTGGASNSSAIFVVIMGIILSFIIWAIIDGSSSSESIDNKENNKDDSNDDAGD